MGRVWPFWAALLAGLALAFWSAPPPAPSPVSAPAQAFSAARAMTDVRAIGATPHPSGSRAIQRVRSYLVSRLGSLGLQVEVRDVQGILSRRVSDLSFVSAGAMRDVVGILPGRDRTLPALLVMSHYDTVPNSPGAADDTAGGATALEIARALTATGPHARDVMFLFTDGEEAGLLGAQGFFAHDPLARRVGAVINLEARGDSGRALMFETGPGSGGLVRLLGGRGVQPTANSLMAFVYHLMPNDTDFTEARTRGLPGLNFAFEGDELAYHTPFSTPGHLNQRSLQHMGGQALPVALVLADTPKLPTGGPDLVYSDLFGRWLVAYPAWIGWALAGAAAVLLILILMLVKGRGLARSGEIATGAAGTLLVTLAVALALKTAETFLSGGGIQGFYARLAVYPWLFAGAALLAFGVALAMVGELTRGGRRVWTVLLAAAAGVVCNLGGFDPVGTGLAVGVIVLALICLGRATPAWGLWSGALILGLILTVIAQALAPAVAFAFAWPLLAGAAAAAVAVCWPGELNAVPAQIITAAIAALAVGQFGGLASISFEAVGPVMLPVLAVPTLLISFVLIPLAALAQGAAWRRTIPLVAVAAGAALLGFVASGGGTGPSRPKLTNALFYADPQAKRFERVSTLARLDRWSRAALSADGEPPTRTAVPPLFPRPVWSAPAKAVALAPPALTVAKTALGAETRIRITVRPRRDGEVLLLLLRPTSALRATGLSGASLGLPATPNQWSELEYDAPGPNGVSLDLLVAGPGKLDVEAVELRPGWPEGAAAPPPKPPGLMAWSRSDYTAVAADARTAW